jgi:SAM-dependent methyltransferase
MSAEGVVAMRRTLLVPAVHPALTGRLDPVHLGHHARPVSLTDRLYGAYDWAVERPAVARPFGRLLWGADTRVLYEAHGVVATAPPGATVLDVPCGGGVAFRALPRRRDIRYVAVDLDEAMLRRARAEAARRGHDEIEFVRAQVEHLPLESASVDVCLCSAGLHCFPDPAAALSEIARCLRPGGRLVATMAVRGRGTRQDGLIAFYRRVGIFGPTGTAEQYRRWALDAGLTGVELELSGAIARLEARREGAVRRRGTS